MRRSRVVAVAVIAVCMAAVCILAQGRGASTFTDPRDGKSYRTVVIGTQTWMAENLNWAGTGGDLGWCYDNAPDSCAKYGRLYDWSTVMNLPSSCNTTSCASQVQAVHQGICPPGWHVPSDDEWTTLVSYAGGSSITGAKLRSVTGWHTGSGHVPGTDDYGFSALPGGGRWSGRFSGAGNSGYWWSATVGGATRARSRYMYWHYAYVSAGWDYKTNGFSARCVRD